MSHHRHFLNLGGFLHKRTHVRGGDSPRGGRNVYRVGSGERRAQSERFMHGFRESGALPIVPEGLGMMQACEEFPHAQPHLVYDKGFQ